MNGTASLVSEVRKQNLNLHCLSSLLLSPRDSDTRKRTLEWLANLDEQGKAELLAYADTHHVTLRAFETLAAHAIRAGNKSLVEWAVSIVAAEENRRDTALEYLESICRALGESGHALVVIKSLEHFPDLGSDLDLYTDAEESSVLRVMTSRFQARILYRSWGDRLAHKWNFSIPGLRELIEIHVGRSGQTGEQTAFPNRMAVRSVERKLQGHSFTVPAAEEAVIVTTFQRMYRHFYLRLCDILNTGSLIQNHKINDEELRTSADLASVWPGTTTFLRIVADYVQAYGEAAIDLPREVLAASKFGAGEVTFGGKFVRVPIFWQAAHLYAMQVASTARRGNVPATLRLGLLPCLGAAAVLEYKLTGDDKRIW